MSQPTFDLDMRRLANGTHQAKIFATDLSKNVVDAYGVVKIDIFSDGQLIGAVNKVGIAPQGGLTFSWIVSAAQNGVRNLTVKAFDAAGNSKVSAPRPVTISIP